MIGVLVLAACSSDDDSYTMGPPGEPGTVVRSGELDVPEIAGTIWEMTYRSQTVAGDRTEVTGYVARPDAPPPEGGYPLLSWAHGTTGIADECAPSAYGPAPTYENLQPYLDAGYVVAATDYEGLGGPGVHPYLVAGSEARSVLDAARAAHAIVPELGDTLLVGGHSQGGHAALATAELAADWAPELDLVATFAVAPLADLTLAVPAMFGLPDAGGFAVLIAAGWADAYDDLDVGDVLGSEGIELAERAVDDWCVADVFQAVTEAEVEEIVATPPRELAPWRTRTEENAIRPDRVSGPVLIVHGTDDPLIPVGLSERFVGDLCAAGAEIAYRPYGGEDHGSVVAASFDDIIGWLDDRIAGVPLEPDC